MTDEVRLPTLTIQGNNYPSPNDVPYDFSLYRNFYVMTGHMHEDYNALINDIMVVTSIDNRTSQGL